MLDNFMRRFAVWFGSPKGVMQTFLFTTLIGVAEQVWPSVDPQHFFYMYLMTYYSTVTQTVLAYAANLSAKLFEETLDSIRDIVNRVADVQTKQADVQKRQEEMDKTMLQLAKNQTDMMNAFLVMMQGIQAEIHEIAEDTEELTEDDENC